jgi:hypothetical protein
MIAAGLEQDGEDKMVIIVWSPDDLIEQMTDLMDDRWEIIAYWFNGLSNQREGYVLAGRQEVSQARVRKSLERIHRDGGEPYMRYHVSTAHNPPVIEDGEICRVSRDGITAVACDFTGLAQQSVQLGLNALSDVVQEEREKCAEIIEAVRDHLGLASPAS